MAESLDIRELNRLIEQQSAFVTNLTTGMKGVIVGQKHLVESLLISLLSDGHILLEGVPGLAKTLAIKTLAQLVDAAYSRIQFTPDLLPADVVGTLVYSQKEENFQVKKGPVFANFVLADEINRASPKTQSALLEAMEEKQVSVEGETRPLPSPFFVIATQNPLEQLGTYALPESQLDRFLMRISLGYPDRAAERALLQELATAVIVRSARIVAATYVAIIQHRMGENELENQFVAVDGSVYEKVPLVSHHLRGALDTLLLDEAVNVKIILENAGSALGAALAAAMTTRK